MLSHVAIWVVVGVALGAFVIGWWPVHFLHLWLAFKARRVGLERVRIAIDAARWPVFRSDGIANGTAAVILHGFGVDSYSMLSIAGALCREGHPVVLPDLPGFGDHRFDKGQAYDETFMIKGLEALADALGAGRVVVIGSSMGGALAAAWAHRHPDRIVGLILLDPAGVEPPIENEIYAAKADESNPLEIRTIADFDRILALNFVHPPRVPWVIKHGLVRRARGLADQHACIMRDLEPLLRDGLRGRLRTIDRPVLLIWDEADRIIDPSVVPLWEAELPDIEVLLLAHCGHVPWMDRPMETKAAICRFMGNEWA